MGVTTVRDRLAAALREHAGFHNDYDREVGSYHQCQCGASGSGNTTLVEHMGHLADVLLALPGIAIVRLPEPTESGNFPTQEREDPLVWQVRATHAGSTALVSYGDKLMPTWYARRLAAALLAAAAEVER